MADATQRGRWPGHPTADSARVGRQVGAESVVESVDPTLLGLSDWFDLLRERPPLAFEALHRSGVVACGLLSVPLRLREETIQETMLQILAKSFSPLLSGPKGARLVVWVAGIVRRVLLRLLREERRAHHRERALASRRPPSGEVVGPDAALERSDELRLVLSRVEAAVRRFAPSRQRVAELLLCGFPYGAISAVLSGEFGVGPDAARYLIRTTKVRLRSAAVGAP